MSKMMLRSSKPPLPRSPIRLRSRRALRSTTNTLQTPPGSLTKSKLPNPRSDVEEWEMRLEYHTISCELRALAKMVQQEIGNGDGGDPIPGNGEYSLNPRSPLFERGRLYEEYSARRNERLKRKKGGETEEEKKAVYGLGVRVESAKKRGVSVTPMMAQRGEGEKPRYMLRSMATSKENKKPPPHLPMSVEKSVGGGEKKKTTAIRVASDADPDVAHLSGMSATILGSYEQCEMQVHLEDNAKRCFIQHDKVFACCCTWRIMLRNPFLLGSTPVLGRGQGKKSEKNLSGSSEDNKKGAAFLAVCRGKVSEGIDFSDEMARVDVSFLSFS
nr:uncharacterized protein LOC109165633 [Ipomoea trifida]